MNLYQRAIQLDPRFLQAHAELSRGHSLLRWNYYDLTEQRLELAKDEAEEALRLDPESPDAHLALGYYFYWGREDYDRALREFAAALARQPNNSELLYATGLVQRRQGKWAEAFAHLKRAAELDPRSIDVNQALAETGAVIRDYPEVERAAARIMAFKPDVAWGYADKAELDLHWRGDTAGASRVLREGFERAGHGVLISPAAFVLDRDPTLQAAFARFSAREFPLDGLAQRSTSSSTSPRSRPGTQRTD